MSERGPDLDEAEARRIMAGGLGRAELEFATSVCAPLYWIIREAEGRRRVRNGTAFFLMRAPASSPLRPSMSLSDLKRIVVLTRSKLFKSGAISRLTLKVGTRLSIETAK